MNSIILKPRNAILILLIFSLGLYYKTINAELFSLDDKGLIYSYNNGNTDIKNFFFPQEAHSYYRPAVHLSFLVDYLIWMDNESGFHLTNIILNSANVILVYLLCLLMLDKFMDSRNREIINSPTHQLNKLSIAFFAALLFAIHPINTEAVNFIAARTDILATFFVLISFILYKQSAISSQRSALGYLFLSILACLLAILSKEVALTFPLIIMAHEYFLPCQPLPSGEKDRVRLKSAFRMSIIFVIPAIIYFYLRPLGVSEVDIGMRKTMGIADKISADLFADIAAAVGFYLKKLIYPFPLNFAIVEINKGPYFVIGAICLLLLIISAVKHRLSGFLLWSIFFSLLPSIAISLTDISWTPYAERYLYLPSVFFCILFSFQLLSFVPRPSSLIIMITITLVFSAATYKRNIIWLNNLTIWEDIAKKSPTFGKAYNEYGVALVMKGENEKAEKQFLKAAELGYKTIPLFNLGHFAIKNNDFLLAERYFTEGVQNDPNPAAYRKLGSIYLEKSAKDNGNISKAIEYLEKAYQMDKGDEMLALKLAGLYCHVSRYEDAKVVLQKVINDNPDSYIEKSAKKILDKVNSKLKI